MSYTSSRGLASTSIVSLWVKPEPFMCGVFPVAPNHMLAPKFLRKIIPYAKTKKELGFPKLSYSVWRHIACAKLQLPEELAWLYFSTYHSLTKVRPDDRIRWDTEYARCSPQEREQLKSTATVDTLKFVILLFIQLLNKTYVRSKSVSSLSNEEWPIHIRSDTMDGRMTFRSGKILEEHRYLQFVLHHIEDIVELLCSGEQHSLSKSAFVPIEVITALGFILEGSVDGHLNVLTLADLATSHAASSGYIPSAHVFHYKPLIIWLKSKMSTNPFGISSCVTSGRRISWPAIRSDQRDKVSSGLGGKVATNAHYAVKGKKVLVLSQINSQTVARSPHVSKGATVQIHRCHHSYIYLLSSMRCVSIYKCCDSTVVLGPVSSCVVVVMCRNLRIISVTRRLWVRDSTNCQFYLLIATRPLFAGNKNDSILLAPYHTFYPKLDDDSKEAGLSNCLNLWDQPLCLTSDGNIHASKCWKLLDPSDIYIFSIPFDMEGPTKKIPGGLPIEYQQVLQEYDNQMEKWHKTVKEADLNQKKRDQLHHLVQTRFQAWLLETGHQRELDSLVMTLHSSNQVKSTLY